MIYRCAIMRSNREVDHIRCVFNHLSKHERRKRREIINIIIKILTLLSVELDAVILCKIECSTEQPV